MKVRSVFVLAAVFFALGSAFSSDFQTAKSANFGARCAVPSFERAFDESKAVFVGEVVAEEKNGDLRRFDFKIEKYWKGANVKNAEILVYETARFQAWFKKGGQYLIYAREDERGELRVERCSRSRDVEFAEEDLQKLGEGKIPR